MTKASMMNMDENSYLEIFSTFRPTAKTSISQVQDMLKSLVDQLSVLEQSDEGLPSKATSNLSTSLLNWWRKSYQESEAQKESSKISKSNNILETVGIYCCSGLIELLRLTAPDCPMTNKQLKVRDLHIVRLFYYRNLGILYFIPD